MTHVQPRDGSGAVAISVLVGVGLWSLAMVAVGVVWNDHTWGSVALGAGLACAVATGLGAAFHRWRAALYGVLLLTAIAQMVVGGLIQEPSWIGLGLVAMIVVGASVPISVSMGVTAGGDHGEGMASSREVIDLLHRIHEHSMLSDNARRVLFRERELGLLRDAIEIDIRESKYNAGLTLCDEMADVFGYREEAEAFRARIVQARTEHYEEEAAVALAHLDELLARRDWALAHHEAARIKRLFSESHLLDSLDSRIHTAREQHKVELERAFLAAAERDDVEEAMSVLKELDRYLDRDEAERLAEVAQGIVARHRENLGVQFKLAVSDHRWAEAISIGEALVVEFPNTKMADEVRSMLDTLRSRADQAAVG